MNIKLVVRLGLGCLLLTGTRAQAGWVDYFGAHYGAKEWSSVVRTHSFGVTEDTYESLSNKLVTELQGYPAEEDLVLIVGGLGSGRDPVSVASYLDAIEADGAERWKSNVRQRAQEVANLAGARRVVWQIGNEITSQKYSENLHAWAGDSGTVMSFDETTIPIYVEYYLAPTVEALREVSKEQRQRIPVALGSITNFGNDDAPGWLDAVLDYTIEGRFAPSLTGRKVNQVVNVITLHYFMAGPDWEERLDHVAQTWLRQGGIRAVWSTEEVGVNAADSGYGAAAAIRIFARGLSWWGPRRFPGRVIFWGQDRGEDGTQVSDAMTVVYDAIGDTEVSLASRDELPTASGKADLEVYRFLTADAGKSLLVVATSDDEPTAVSRLRVGDASLGQPAAYVFDDSGSQPIETSTEGVEGSQVDVVFASPVEVAANRSLLVILDSP